MSDVPRRITGKMLAPDGQPITNRTLTWYRTNRRTLAQGASVIVDEVFRTATNALGEVDVSVVAGAYLVMVRLADQDRYFEVGVPEGAGPAQIQDLIDTAAPVLTPPLLIEAQDARDAAILARTDAETARDKAQQWAESPTTPDGPDTRSARTWALEASADAGQAQADRIQTGLDREATGEDRVQTGLDRVATGEDRAQTGEDRIQTGVDAVAASASAALAQDWAEKQTEPGGSGTKSARTWAGEAAQSASDAATSEGNASGALTSFQQRYLGPKSSPPLVDNDGQPLVVGALYWNISAGEMRAWDGSAWQASYLPPTGFLQSALNLSDLNDAGAARANLGTVSRTGDDLDGGFTAVAVDDGTRQSGTYTPSPTGGNFRRIVNGGAFTFAAPAGAGDYTMIVHVTNSASAGPVTLTGFSKVDGDFTVTDGDAFLIYLTKCWTSVSAAVVALQ